MFKHRYYAYEKDNSKLIIGFLGVVLSLTCFIINVFSLSQSPYVEQLSPNISVRYQNMTVNQMEEMSSILKEVDSKYIIKQQVITFVPNIKPYCSNCIAYNRNDGEELVIQYNSNKRFMEYVICHELLHSYFYTNENYEEDMVDEIARTYICYKDKGGIVDQRWKTS